MCLQQKHQLRTRELVSSLSVILWVITSATVKIDALTIDNQLVSGNNDCFERIVLGSMLPFESAFRNVDMNSLSECKELCLREEGKCNTIAFGISSRGNGTCQLSSKVLDKSQRRPSGTIFDPDFDLYERRSDCLDPNGSFNGSPTPGNFGPPTEARPETSGPPPPPFGTVVTTNGLPPSTNSEASSPFNGGNNNPPDDRYSPSPPSPSPSGDRNGRFPGSSSYPSSAYGVSEGTFETTYSARPFETTFPTAQTSYSDRNKDTIYFSHDGFPMYKYPTLYENNSPTPNGDRRFPATYAPNIPTLEDRYKPLPSDGDYYPIPPNTTPRPIYGLGYGNGYSYGTPVKYGSTRPYGPGSSGPQSRPTSPYSPDYSPRPTSSYGNERPSTYHPRPQRPLTDTQYAYRPDPEYSDRPTSGEPSTYGTTPLRPGPSQTPLSGGDYRPSRPYPDDRPRPGYGTTPEGKYSTTEGPIETYFNPDDYLEAKWTVKPGSYGGGDRFGGRYPSFDQRASKQTIQMIFN